MTDYSDLFSQHEPDPLLRELNGNVLWRYEPMNPHDQRPPISSTAPFQAVERIKALEGSLAKYSCGCPYPCALYDAEKAKEDEMPHMMCGWWAKSVLENPK
jgi:hypothetical protein